MSTEAEKFAPVPMEAAEALEVSSSETPELIESVTTENSAAMGAELAETLETACLEEEIRSGFDAIQMAGHVDVGDQLTSVGGTAYPKTADQNGKCHET
ncbi:MAG: hypothetical protein AAGC99_14200 [Pseudomonadota bacterium]